MSINVTQVEDIADTAAPILSVALAADPEIALALKLVPIAIQLLQAAQQITSAGAMTPQQLALLFSQIGQGVLSAHTAWDALNAKSN